MDHYALSTHEGPQTARWFDITGSEHPMPGSIPVTDQPDPGTPDEVRRAARLVFSTQSLYFGFRR